MKKDQEWLWERSVDLRGYKNIGRFTGIKVDLKRYRGFGGISENQSISRSSQNTIQLTCILGPPNFLWELIYNGHVNRRTESSLTDILRIGWVERFWPCRWVKDWM